MSSLALACRLGAGSTPTLPRRVRSILRKYGATLLIPGPAGILQYGFQPGNYRESTGQTLAAVDQQVGFVVDAAQAPGPELAAPVSAWTLSIDPSLALVGEEAVFTAAPTGQLITCPMSISEKTLAVEFEISEYVAGTLQVRTIGGTTYTSSVTHSGNGRKREVIKALAGNSTLGIRVASAFTGRVKIISVRELPGIHALQATSGYQPYLRQSGGVNSWQFDGVDDRLPLVSLPLAAGDDFYQAFALRCATNAANKTFADLLTNPATGTRLGCLRITSGNVLQVVHANDAGGVQTVSGRSVSDGQLIIVEALRAGTSHTVFADGAVDIQTTLSGNYTTTHATIGARGQGTSEPYLGHMHGSIICKGTPSEGERAILRKFLAQLQGRSL